MKVKEESIPLRFGCDDHWHWDCNDKSNEVVMYGPDLVTAHFHPKWSNGTAAVRGTRIVNRCSARFYWEIEISDRIFGTSMMFGVATKSARLHADSFVNIVGEDQHSFGLSHKGLLWHNGRWQSYTRPFRENESTTVGLLYDSREGTLSYFKDRIFLGIAFTGLNLIDDDLYPIISSTAAKTEMTVSNMRREYYNLQDRCRDVILRSVQNRSDVMLLKLPMVMEKYLRNVSIDDDDDGHHHHHRNQHNSRHRLLRQQQQQQQQRKSMAISGSSGDQQQSKESSSSSSSMTHFHHSLYSSSSSSSSSSCADSRNHWNNRYNHSKTPFLEL
ncbi:SPRY domain-containing SOCS box protein 4-like [Oppia nitens]|uniref:SPRY domain-containing SOCS box protein 4-like n=1 Tax=Oppia nitens TaxID=1686743 RepID=UPI0023DB8240|nr:SPRY domain-containing SOCS box protein 4-like [Oppia nitens]